jgi:ABC-type dipeptide/oligopeptide/nickel transport system permease subunit
MSRAPAGGRASPRGATAVALARPLANPLVSDRPPFYYAWRWSRSFLTTKPLGAIGAVIMAVLLFAAVFAGPIRWGPHVGAGPLSVELPGSLTIPGISPHDPLDVHLRENLEPPSAVYPLGTDQLGRDLLSRIIHGARVSLQVGVLSVLISTLAGALIGTTTAYFRGTYDLLAQRVMDSIQIVLASVQLGAAILAEAALSFLGLGPPPPEPTWGRMLSGAGRKFMESAPWLAIFPGIAISLAVLGFNLLGDALRDALDPRLRGSQ